MKSFLLSLLLASTCHGQCFYPFVQPSVFVGYPTYPVYYGQPYYGPYFVPVYQQTQWPIWTTTPYPSWRHP